VLCVLCVCVCVYLEQGSHFSTYRMLRMVCCKAAKISQLTASGRTNTRCQGQRKHPGKEVGITLFKHRNGAFATVEAITESSCAPRYWKRL